MPTVPLKATPLPPADAPREPISTRLRNARQHGAIRRHWPSAMSIPCGMSDGLPTGLMMIGALRRVDNLPRRGGLRKSRRLEEDVTITSGAITFSLPEMRSGRGTARSGAPQYRGLQE
jgi:hypothetical protein